MTPTEQEDFSRDGWIEFILFDLALLGLQIVVFYCVAWFYSFFFTSEPRLVEYINSKVSHAAIVQLGITGLAIFLILGVLSSIGPIIPEGAFKKIFSAVLQELPRTIYYFGSTVISAFLAIATFLSLHPPKEAPSEPETHLIRIAIALVISTILYGTGINCFFRWVRFKKSQ